MSIPPVQSPWRNSTLPAPRGRNLSSGYTRRLSHNGFPLPISIIKPPNPDCIPPVRDLHEGLEDAALASLDVPNLEDGVVMEDTEIKNCVYIGSYNWMKGEHPVILIPGSPPRWTSRQTPYTVPPDVGLRFIDQNSYWLPKCPLLPLILAVNKCSETQDKPAFKWSGADFITDKDSLCKLVWWVEGRKDRDFRIDFQLAGKKTLLLNQWEKQTCEIYNGRTYTSSFFKASTEVAPGCKDSGAHYRVITYDLHGFTMVVRFEVDACLPPPMKFPRRSLASVDDLMRSMSAVTLAPSLSLSQSEPRLTILEGGTTQVSPASLIRIDTRSESRIKQSPIDQADLDLQLWFGQMTHHVLAIHQRGRYISADRKKFGTSTPPNAQIPLKKLRMALRLIADLVIEHGKEGRLSLVCVGGEMKVYKRTARESCLPELALRVFDEVE